MRYILALIPLKQIAQIYVLVAKMLFSSVHDGYLLSEETSFPHVTICQFECNDDEKVESIWKDVKELGIEPFAPRFTGVSFIKGVGIYEQCYWAEVSVARDPAIMKTHQSIVAAVQSNDLTCCNDSGDLYRPHLTLSRIRLSDLIARWPDDIVTTRADFGIVLGRADGNWQLVEVIHR